jgi:hypothetical protein
VLIERIISGGQTGVDRGALDAALESAFPCGGWCPAGRRAEDGVIAARYPLLELTSTDYPDRTLRNVRDSDGTLILYTRVLSGGTRLTAELCRREHKPLQLIDAVRVSPACAAQTAAEFVTREAIRVLNVAGPRQSGWPGAHAFSCEVVGRLLALARADAEAGRH